MLKYLVILLDNASSAYCHCDNPMSVSQPIPIAALERGIQFARDNGLAVQMVYPETELPKGYAEIIESIEHAVIAPCNSSVPADITVCNSAEELSIAPEGSICIFRQSKEELFSDYNRVPPLLSKFKRLNLVLKDVETFNDKDIKTYLQVLSSWAATLIGAYKQGDTVASVNVLSDRLVLESMNNCNAGVDSITLAPDGRFYICPAFYYKPVGSYVGTLEEGVSIPNQYLYSLDNAPICRNCDAWHCRRCVWLNKRLTREVNTPSHQQCIISHAERESSRRLQSDLRAINIRTGVPVIPALRYWDPLDAMINQNKNL